jgi:transposase
MFGIRSPTYSALCKSRKRIPVSLWQKLLKLTSGLSSGKIAIDGSGFSKRNASFHYMKRVGISIPNHGYNKVSIAYDIETKKIHKLRARIKPRNDVLDVKYLLRDLSIDELYADRGYDAEWIFELCNSLKIEPQIKMKTRNKKGFYRRKARRIFDENKYSKRSLVECGFSCVKRKYGGNVLARKNKGIKAEMYLKAIAHNMKLKH